MKANHAFDKGYASFMLSDTLNDNPWWNTPEYTLRQQWEHGWKKAHADHVEWFEAGIISEMPLEATQITAGDFRQGYPLTWDQMPLSYHLC